MHPVAWHTASAQAVSGTVNFCKAMQEGAARQAIKLDWSDFDTALHATVWPLAGGPGLCYIVSLKTWAEGVEEGQGPTLPRDPGSGRPTGAAGRNEEVR
jgi:hypothetical protein